VMSADSDVCCRVDTVRCAPRREGKRHPRFLLIEPGGGRWVVEGSGLCACVYGHVTCECRLLGAHHSARSSTPF
jgi:hypothetical protein